MGDMADDNINGACCGWCSSYFKEEHGYPVLCPSCWNKATKEEREGWQEANIKEM